MQGWIIDAHSGGEKIAESLKVETRQRILDHAEKLYYIDAYIEPDARGSPWKVTKETREQFLERLRTAPTHLCRLRHFGPDRWSVAFFTYSHERYEPTFFQSGEAFGTPEEGLDVGGVYLTD